MQQHAAELNALNVDVAVVTFESIEVARHYAGELVGEWPLLLDAARDLYRAYGIDRGSHWAIYGPSSWWGYIKLLARGRRLKLPTDDTHQRGGDVLIDPDAIIRLHHVGHRPVDRPSVESLLNAVRQAGRRDDGTHEGTEETE